MKFKVGDIVRDGWQREKIISGTVINVTAYRVHVKWPSDTIYCYWEDELIKIQIDGNEILKGLL